MCTRTNDGRVRLYNMYYNDCVHFTLQLFTVVTRFSRKPISEKCIIYIVYGYRHGIVTSDSGFDSFSSPDGPRPARKVSGTWNAPAEHTMMYTHKGANPPAYECVIRPSIIQQVRSCHRDRGSWHWRLRTESNSAAPVLYNIIVYRLNRGDDDRDTSTQRVADHR